MRWRGKGLEEWSAADILPRKLRLDLTGGTEVGEKARVAWALGQTLPEFEQRPQEDQEWAIVTWRVENKIQMIQAAEGFRE